MKILVVSQREVRDLLPMNECIPVMEEALRNLNEGNALNPLRSGVLLPDKKGLLGLMPGYLGDKNILGLKAVTVFSGNHGTSYDSHQGAVMIFETNHGCPLAIMDASEITAIRTAAVSAVATNLLANDEAADLAILGSGVQAATHLAAMKEVRELRRVRVWSKTAENVQRFADLQSKETGVTVEISGTARAAVEGANLICTTTAAREPVLVGEWVSSGAHINAVGSSIKSTRELDTHAVVQSRLFVDQKESTVNEAGDYLFPKNEGEIDEKHIQGEIGDILLNKVRGRQSASEITLFKSLGLAIEDLAAAFHIYQKLEKSGEGTRIDLGGRKHQ